MLIISSLSKSLLKTSLCTRPIRCLSTTITTYHQQPKMYDLTSDTATEPTDDMFDIMKSASRSDDVFGVR